MRMNSELTRARLLEDVLKFVTTAAQLPGVVGIAMLGPLPPLNYGRKCSAA